jgi:hypothetical protein
VGELLLAVMLERAVMLRAAVATLEVRVSNLVAQNLYTKYEFDRVGHRKRYYHDNGEDAYIMTVPALGRGVPGAFLKRASRRCAAAARGWLKLAESLWYTTPPWLVLAWEGQASASPRVVSVLPGAGCETR